MNDKYLLEQATEFFYTLSHKKESTFNAFSYVQETINSALKNNDYDQLSSLISYMESGPGYSAFSYIGEARRIFRVLSIIDLEKRHNQILFSHNCNSLDTLMEKYVLVLFALRRIIFHLSDSSVEDAMYYLYNQNLTPFSIYVITKEELIVPNKNLYKIIADLYQELWTDEDKDLYFSLINYNTNKHC